MENIIQFVLIQIVRTVFKHLKGACMGYRTHWWRAMSMSVALFIHAWIPDLFQTYASNKINGDIN
jgi:hypothetical protein